jgi:hypothetical protein
VKVRVSNDYGSSLRFVSVKVDEIGQGRWGLSVWEACTGVFLTRWIYRETSFNEEYNSVCYYILPVSSRSDVSRGAESQRRPVYST